MNTDFNILWFEDNEVWYDSIKTDIEEYLKELCFQPNIVYYRSIFDDTLESTINRVSFDLIFADLNLNQSDKQNDKGSEAISILRGKNILADVLFYSTDGIDKIRDVMKADVFEGVYTSVRDEYLLPDKAKQLIDKIVKRSEDFLNIRGLVMDNVSEFDEKLKDVIRKYLGLCNDQERTDLNTYAYDKVLKQISDNAGQAEELKDNFIINALENSFLIDSFKLSQIVNKIFKEKYKSCYQMKNFHENYDKKILKERNKLAHAKKEPEVGGAFYFTDKDGKRTNYDSLKCREIRGDINYYSDLLDKIFDEVK